jgi:hypothetical protein
MAQYTTGTVDVTNGSATVLGTGTEWLTEAEVGDSFAVLNEGVLYDIAAVTSDTEIQLSAPYAGVTSEDISYIIQRDFTANTNLPELSRGALETAAVFTRAMRQIDTGFGDIFNRTDYGDAALNLETENEASFARYNDDGTITLRSAGDFRGDINVEDGATANQTDAFLLARSNHTGTQPVSTLSDAGTAATANVTTTPTGNPSGSVWRTNDLVKTTGPTDLTEGSVLIVGGAVTPLASIYDFYALRTQVASLAEGQRFDTTGYHPATEVGGGGFVWKPDEPKANHNGGTIHSPTVPSPDLQAGADLSEQLAAYIDGTGEEEPGGSGCLVRGGDILAQPIWSFGAHDTLSDNLSPIQKALDLLNYVSIPPKTFKILGNLNVSRRDQRVYGFGLKSVIQQDQSNTNIFTLVSGVSAGVQIGHMLLVGSSSASFATGGIAIDTRHAGDLRFTGVTVSGMFSGWYIDTRTLVTTSDVWLFQCKAFNCKSAGFDVNNGTQIYLEKCDAISCERGFRFTDGSAYHMLDCLSLSNTTHGVQFTGTNIDWVWLNQVESDANGVDGFRFTNCRGVHMAQCWAGTSGAIGFNMVSGNRQFEATTCTSRSNQQHGWFLSGIEGFFASDCNGRENNKAVGDNSGFFIGTGGSSIHLTNCDASNLTGSSQTRGIHISGASTEVHVLGGRTIGNATEQISIPTTGVWSVRGVEGFKTRASGSATVADGTGSTAVSHGLARTPTCVQLTPRDDLGSLRAWAAAAGASTFTAQLNTTTSGNKSFFWEASAETSA